MDSSQYRPQIPRNSSMPVRPRPEYPTPPPSYFHEYVSQLESYSESYNYEGGFTQTPTPSPSHSSSPFYDQGSHPHHLAAISPGIRFSTAEALSPEYISYSSPPGATPPASPYEPDDDESTIVSVSTAFHPNAHPHLPPADTVFSSMEGVLFYAHSKTILNTCASSFCAFLGSSLESPHLRDTLIPLDASSEELNVILHMLYGTSPAAHSPCFETLSNAIDRMPSYSIPPNEVIRPATPLYDLLLSHAPLHPLDTYGLAAHHKLHALAVATSSHLLSYSLPSITDDQAERMGSIYLKKLLLLHVERFTALKKILLQPPHPHPPTKQCGFHDQKRLTRAWALVSAHLAWDAKPDLSTHSMHSALNPLMEHLDCELCHQALCNRIKNVVVQWASVGVSAGVFSFSIFRNAFLLVEGNDAA